MTPTHVRRRFDILRRGIGLLGCLGTAGSAPARSGVALSGPGKRPGGRPAVAPLVPLAAEPLRQPRVGPAGDPRVGLVGLGFYTESVVNLCAEVGLSVGFAVDDLAGTDRPRPLAAGARTALAKRGIPLLSAAEFAARARDTEDGLTLVAGRVECELPLAPTDDPFRQLTEWVSRTIPGQELPLHPAALLALADPVHCPDRYAVFGFPGSGNVLAQNLVAALFARNPELPPPAWQGRAVLSEQYFYGVSARVGALLEPLAPTRVEFIPYDFGTMRVSVECGGRAGVVYDVPSDRHLGLPAFPAHAQPTRRAVDFFASVGAPCVAVVRHPLEALLSGANKILRPCRAVLDGTAYLEQATDMLAEWTAHLLANRDRVHVVRYEDLVARRTDVLLGMAAFVGRPLTGAEATGLIDQLLHRNLFDTPRNRNLNTATAQHFYRGGNDKWRGEFEPRDLRRILARLPASAFTAFGYEVPTEADLCPVPFRGTPMPKSELYACLLASYPVHRLPGPFGIQVTGCDEPMVEALSAAFQDAGLLAHLAAGLLTHELPAAGWHGNGR